jgi:GNAT superfamily N-acetyltransferase
MMKRLAAFHGDKSKASASFIAQHALGPRKSFHILVAVLKGSLVGFCAMVYAVDMVSAIKKTRVEYMFVDEAFRQQGIATALIQESMRIALKDGVRSFSITADPHNKLSNKAYGQTGLTQTKKTHMRYGADVQFMKQFTAQTHQRKKVASKA